MKSVIHVLGDAAAPLVAPAFEMGKPGLTLGLSAVGALAGYFLGKSRQHPVLGVFAGMGVGCAAGQAASGYYGLAATSVAAVAAGTGLSLRWKAHPAWGYVLGSLVVGGVSTAVFDGASVLETFKEVKKF